MFLLLLHYFLMHLSVIKVAHLDSLLMLALPTVLILDPILNHVIKSKDIPCVVGFRLHLTFSSVLERRLSEIDRILFVCRTKIDLLSAQAGGTHRCATLSFGLDVHGPMRDRREHTLSSVWQVDWIVTAERHAFQAGWWWLQCSEVPFFRFVTVPSLLFLWWEELLDIHLGHRSWYHEWSMAMLWLEPAEALFSALHLLDETIYVGGTFERLLRVHVLCEVMNGRWAWRLHLDLIDILRYVKDAALRAMRFCHIRFASVWTQPLHAVLEGWRVH